MCKLSRFHSLPTGVRVQNTHDILMSIGVEVGFHLTHSPHFQFPSIPAFGIIGISMYFEFEILLTTGNL